MLFQDILTDISSIWTYYFSGIQFPLHHIFPSFQSLSHSIICTLIKFSQEYFIKYRIYSIRSMSVPFKNLVVFPRNPCFSSFPATPYRSFLSIKYYIFHRNLSIWQFFGSFFSFPCTPNSPQTLVNTAFFFTKPHLYTSSLYPIPHTVFIKSPFSPSLLLNFFTWVSIVLASPK